MVLNHNRLAAVVLDFNRFAAAMFDRLVAVPFDGTAAIVVVIIVIVSTRHTVPQACNGNGENA
ncbi:MAG: hypothetical protein Tsb009_26670 [Planctomycetaceae bacterium]